MTLLQLVVSCSEWESQRTAVGTAATIPLVFSASTASRIPSIKITGEEGRIDM